MSQPLRPHLHIERPPLGLYICITVFIRVCQEGTLPGGRIRAAKGMRNLMREDGGGLDSTYVHSIHMAFRLIPCESWHCLHSASIFFSPRLSLLRRVLYSITTLSSWNSHYLDKNYLATLTAAAPPPSKKQLALQDRLTTCPTSPSRLHLAQRLMRPATDSTTRLAAT